VIPFVSLKSQELHFLGFPSTYLYSFQALNLLCRKRVKSCIFLVIPDTYYLVPLPGHPFVPLLAPGLHDLDSNSIGTHPDVVDRY
jgi:hypothetical protein